MYILYHGPIYKNSLHLQLMNLDVCFHSGLIKNNAESILNLPTNQTMFNISHNPNFPSKQMSIILEY